MKLCAASGWRGAGALVEQNTDEHMTMGQVMPAAQQRSA